MEQRADDSVYDRIQANRQQAVAEAVARAREDGIQGLEFDEVQFLIAQKADERKREIEIALDEKQSLSEWQKAANSVVVSTVHEEDDDSTLADPSHKSALLQTLVARQNAKRSNHHSNGALGTKHSRTEANDGDNAHENGEGASDQTSSGEEAKRKRKKPKPSLLLANIVGDSTSDSESDSDSDSVLDSKDALHSQESSPSPSGTMGLVNY
jgi:hypothetical protein